MAIAKLSIDIEARLANFEKSLDKVAKSSESMAGRVKSSFSALGSTIGVAIGALAAAGAVGQFKDLVNYLDKFDEAAERIGMTAESLSALAYAGKMTGAEFDDVTTALTKLSSKMQDAAAGNKSAVELFRDIGVSVKDASGNLKSSDQVLAEVADRFAKFEDGAAKTALAVDLFGKSGAKLVPLLNLGSQGMEDMRTEAERLGGVISNELAKQSAQFNDNLDRLGTLAGSAGQSLAGSLLPWLNEVAEGFITSAKHAESFWEVLSRPISGLSFFDANDKLIQARKDLDALELRRQGLMNEGLDTSGVDADIAKLKRTIEYHKELQRNQALANSGDNYGNEGRGLVGASSKSAIARTADSSGKAGKVASPEATAEAKAYADAMDALAKSAAAADAAALGLSNSQKQIYDLMTSPAWNSMPDTWKQTAVAQFEQAYAAEKAADAAARLSQIIKQTPDGKGAELAKDWQLLDKALADGKITADQFFDGMELLEGKASGSLKKQKSLAEEFGLTFTSAFEDAVAGGKDFSDVLKGLESDILRLLTRMAVTEPLGKAVQGIDWGGLVKGVAGMFGTTTANAKGNVYSSPSLSAYSGGVYSAPQFFAFANGAGVFGEAGPEAIMPLKRGADGKLGVSAQVGGGGNVTVNVINNGDGQARTEKRSDGKGGSIIDVIVERAKNAVAADIGSGNGAVPAAMQGAYGLNRRAGAY